MSDLITGDLHFSENERDAYRFVFLEKTLPDLIGKHKPDRLLILGDLTEAKDHHSAKLVNRIVDGLAVISDWVQIVALLGNHDYADARHPFFRFLENIPHIAWINDIRRIDADLFVPHRQPSEFKLQAAPKLPGMVFCHNTFEGAISETGQHLKGIPLKLLNGASGVISGDVHEPQKVGPVTYVGAPYRVRFGDNFEPRVILRDGAKLMSIPVDGPQKILIEITSIDDLIKTYTRHEGIFPDDILKVQVRLKSRGNWAEIKKAVRAWGDKNGVMIHTIKPIVTERLKPRTQAVHTRKADADLVKEYAKNRKLDPALLRAGLLLIPMEK